MFRHFKKYPAFEMKQNGLALRLGQDILTGDFDPARVVARAVHDCKAFCANVEKYRLYP